MDRPPINLVFQMLATACALLMAPAALAQEEVTPPFAHEQHLTDNDHPNGQFLAGEGEWDAAGRDSSDCDLPPCNSTDCGDEFAYGGYKAIGFNQGRWRDWWERFRFRHSSTDGRWTGKGQPLRSTSWLNRPYSFGVETGGLLMASRISSNNTRNNDVLAAVNLGWDWDHYWGTQFRVAWSTPELSSSVPSTNAASNNVLLYDLSLMYYPWGDSRVRPYYRFGLGLTDIDFINPAGVREDATLLSMPIGVGIKYQTRRWVALRAEAVDYITWGQNSASDMQNFTLTFGVECRYGGRPSSAWSSPTQRGAW